MNFEERKKFLIEQRQGYEAVSNQPSGPCEVIKFRSFQTGQHIALKLTDIRYMDEREFERYTRSEPAQLVKVIDILIDTLVDEKTRERFDQKSAGKGE